MRQKPFYESRNPHPVFDIIRAEWKMHSDKELSDLLDIEQSVISRIRSGKLQMSANVILAVHERAGLEIKTVKALLRKHEQP